MPCASQPALSLTDDLLKQERGHPHRRWDTRAEAPPHASWARSTSGNWPRSGKRGLAVDRANKPNQISASRDVLIFRCFTQPSSDALAVCSDRSTRITNSVDRPSQCSGSPYLPFTTGRGDFLLNSACRALLFFALHLLQAVAKLSRVAAPPRLCASTWSITAPSSSSIGALRRVQCLS